MSGNAKPRVLLLGAAGQLGKQLARVLADSVELTAFGRAELDLTDAGAIRGVIRRNAPEVLVNAAAYTAVDRAEQEPELARAVNAFAPGVMADAMHRTGGALIHYSTDYVFDGSGAAPWRESDPTGPLNVYGKTKLEGEQSIAATGCRHVILRTSWVYAAEGRNFLHTMLRMGRERERLTVVDDQVGAPTTAEALAEASLAVVLRLADGGAESGIYHLSCGGETSWCGFARAIFAAFAELHKAPEVVPIDSEAFPTPAKRPRNSRLCCDNFAGEFGLRLPQWEVALDAVARTMLGSERLD